MTHCVALSWLWKIYRRVLFAAKEFLFGGYFILTPHYFDARHGTIIYVLCRCKKMALKSGKGKNEHRFFPTSLRSSYPPIRVFALLPLVTVIVNFISSTGCLSACQSLSLTLYDFYWCWQSRAVQCRQGRGTGRLEPSAPMFILSLSCV